MTMRGSAGALAAQDKTSIERALLYVLKKEEAGTLVATDAGVSEEDETDNGHGHCNDGVALLQKPSGCNTERALLFKTVEH